MIRDLETFPLRGVELLIFPHADLSVAQLEKKGSEVLFAGSKRREGKNAERMKSYWAGRAALKIAFERLGVEAYVRPNEEFGYLEVLDLRGKLLETLFVNISHTESVVAAVVAASPVGVDIERQERNASRVMERVADAREMEQGQKGVFANNGQALKFEIALWSAKEAVSKAFGLGMKFGLNQFRIEFSRELPYRAQTEILGPLAVAKPAVWFDVFNPYFISICVAESSLQSGGIRRGLISSFDFT